jgi:type I restriction enzyme S subunit
VSANTWQDCSLGEIAHLYQGYGFPKHIQGRGEGEVNFFKVSDISNAVQRGSEYLHRSAHCISIEEMHQLRASMLPEGATVFARIGEAIRLNRRALLSAPALVDNNVLGIKGRSGIDDRYIFHFLKTVRLETLSQATTVPAVRSSDISAISIPIPPQNEQKRISARIDELFSSIEAGERALERTRKLVERYRQSVLKAAVTGELTREWRERHKGELESGEALLARILKARRAAWEKSELAKMKANGQKPANDAWKKKYVEPIPPDMGNLPELPVGWSWASLEQLIYEGPTNGYSPKSESESSGTFTLKLTATTSGAMRLDRSAVKRINETIDENSPLWLREGDLLIQRANTIDYLGASAIFNGPENKYIYPDLMMRIRIHDSAVRHWVWRFLNFSQTRHYFRGLATGTAGSMPKISGEIVRGLPIPIPPHKELHHLLERLEEDFDAALFLETTCIAQSAQSGRIRQAILKAAFSGQLVPQDPTDEPASVLLERIAAERAKATKKRLPARGRKKKVIA